MDHNPGMTSQGLLDRLRTTRASRDALSPVDLVHLALNGAHGDEDPEEKGYLSADGVHTNAVGAAVIADVHRELGYEPVFP
jgi:lysophospholipase L1-like esterase